MLCSFFVSETEDHIVLSSLTHWNGSFLKAYFCYEWGIS